VNGALCVRIGTRTARSASMRGVRGQTKCNSFKQSGHKHDSGVNPCSGWADGKQTSHLASAHAPMIRLAVSPCIETRLQKATMKLYPVTSAGNGARKRFIPARMSRRHRTALCVWLYTSTSSLPQHRQTNTQPPVQASNSNLKHTSRPPSPSIFHTPPHTENTLSC